MKYEEFIHEFAKMPYIDMASVVQKTGEVRTTIRMQLHRWCATGRLIPLRRGIYILPALYTMPNPALLANVIYKPSYITANWALSFWGLIPEKTVTFTCVTTRKPAAFENPIGLFRYKHIKASAFFGYQSVELSGAKVLIAEPEKALLDLWYMSPGPWTKERMEGMRFQNIQQVDAVKLRRYAERIAVPRINKACSVWMRLTPDEEGSREL